MKDQRHALSVFVTSIDDCASLARRCCTVLPACLVRVRASLRAACHLSHLSSGKELHSNQRALVEFIELSPCTVFRSVLFHDASLAISVVREKFKAFTCTSMYQRV